MIPVKRILFSWILLVGVTGALADIHDDTLLEEPLEESAKEVERQNCPAEEHWHQCNAACERSCTNSNDNPAVCTEGCRPGCVCNGGLIRGPRGRCIKPKECANENFCPQNEEYGACKGFCELFCSTRNRTLPPTCMDHVYCVSSCICKEGYVRGPKGTCIKSDECSEDDDNRYPVRRVCPKNEVWSGFAHCQTNCTNPQRRLCPRNLVYGCVCVNDYQRNPNGKCIPKKECPRKDNSPSNEQGFCPPNEEFDYCPHLLEEDCGKTEGPLRICVPGCRCKKGYVRGPKGTCIKREQCPPGEDPSCYPVPRQCPENERWGDNAHCQGNCTNPKGTACQMIIMKGCICNRKWMRRPDGKCVPQKECPRTLEASEEFCPPFEEFSQCRAYHEYDCGNTPLPTEETFCVSGCRCVPGYIRGPRGTCIKRENCPSNDITHYPVQRKCPSNEHWSRSHAHCQKNCTQPVLAVCPTLPTPGCVCNRGLLRRSDGKCVPKNQCPKKEDSLVVKSEEILSSKSEEMVKLPSNTDKCANGVECLLALHAQRT